MRKRECGSALVLFLGIMAALSIMSVALVAVVANAQHATSREKSRTTAFDVAEAAIDVSMQLLTDDWPGAQEDAWSATTLVDRAPDFAAEFGVNGAVESDDSLWVNLSDDQDTIFHYDENGNGYLWVDAQATVRGVASRIRTMVQVESYELGMAKGIVVFAGGDLLSNAAGENKTNIGAQDVTVEGPQPVSIVVHGDIDSAGVAWPYVDQDPPLPLPLREELISDQTIADLKLMAQREGKYFTSQPTPADMTGLCVVEIPAGQSVTLGQWVDPNTKETYNSVEEPGILLVLGGGELKLGGQLEYFGVVYCQGLVSASKGTPIIYGMLICDGTFDMGGVAQVIYREDCLTRLDTQFQTNTKLVPNYWRELSPTTPPAL